MAVKGLAGPLQGHNTCCGAALCCVHSQVSLVMRHVLQVGRLGCAPDLPHMPGPACPSFSPPPCFRRPAPPPAEPSGPCLTLALPLSPYLSHLPRPTCWACPPSASPWAGTARACPSRCRSSASRGARVCCSGACHHHHHHYHHITPLRDHERDGVCACVRVVCPKYTCSGWELLAQGSAHVHALGAHATPPWVTGFCAPNCGSCSSCSFFFSKLRVQPLCPLLTPVQDGSCAGEGSGGQGDCTCSRGS